MIVMDRVNALAPGWSHVLSTTNDLNELEYIGNDVLANVYQSNWIVRIDPANGNVREILDFADLYPKRPGYAEVMNGISLSPDGKQLLLTGKMWPVLFEVRLKAAGDTLRP